MENLNILNSLNILHKVSLEENNSILFYFGDIPNWDKNTMNCHPVDPKNFYEVIEIKVKDNLTESYWKIHRYTGKKMFLQVEKYRINIWEGEISEFEEYWGTFDDIEEIKHLDYKLYTLEKSAEDWKSEYEKLSKTYNLLYQKKSFQLMEFRLSLQEEYKNEIDTRINQLKALGHTVDDRTLNQVYSALNNQQIGIKTSSIVDFIFE